MKAVSKEIPAARRRIRQRAFWDTVLGLAGLIYIGTLLCFNIQSPLFAAAFIVLAAYEVIEPRRRKRGS
jgi:fatty acid desaturase